MERTDLTVQQVFAQWIEGLEFSILPDVVVENAKAAIADTIAIAILGASRPRSTFYTNPLLRRRDHGGESTVILQYEKAPVVEAAMLNAIYAHSCELDDTSTAGGHPGAVIVPTALAMAEHERRNGRDLITAVVAGYDIMHRSSIPTHPAASHRGVQTTGKDCCFGATAAAAKLQEIPGETIAQAFAITGNYCCGLMEYDQSGGESKRLYAGLATRAGVESVAFAVAGVTGPRTIWEGRKGVWAVFGAECDPTLATVDLGSDYRIVSGRMVKLYAALASSAIFGLAESIDGPLAASDIKAITIARGGDLSHGSGIQSTIGVATDALGAQFNIAYSCALRVLFGRNDLDLYEDASLWSDPDIIDVCEKVKIVALPEEVSRGGAAGAVKVTLELTDGTVRATQVDAAPGSPENPLTHDQYRDRSVNLMSQAGFVSSVSIELYEMLDHLDELGSIEPITTLLRSGS